MRPERAEGPKTPRPFAASSERWVSCLGVRSALRAEPRDVRTQAPADVWNGSGFVVRGVREDDVAVRHVSQNARLAARARELRSGERADRDVALDASRSSAR